MKEINIGAYDVPTLQIIIKNNINLYKDLTH